MDYDFAADADAYDNSSFGTGGWDSSNTNAIIGGIAALGSSAFNFASAFTTGQNVPLNPVTGQPYPQQPAPQQPQTPNNTLIYIVIVVVLLLVLFGAAYFITKAK